MTPLKQETITNSMVNNIVLNQAATRERQQVEILNGLSVYLSCNCIKQTQQTISNMLFHALAQYRARKNSPKGVQQSKIAWIDTFWIEIDNFFESVLVYEAIYYDLDFHKILTSLRNLDRFPTLVNEFTKIQNRRDEAIRIANENWEKAAKGCGGNNNICIGYSSGPTIPSSVQTPTPCNPLGVSLPKTTRSGKKY